MPAPAANATIASAAANKRSLTVNSFDGVSTIQLGAKEIVRAKPTAQIVRHFANGCWRAAQGQRANNSCEVHPHQLRAA
jgi:hypothetical protein